MIESAIPFSLQLRPCSAQVQKAAAWFISGEDSARWVEEIVAWGISVADAKLYVVPKSSHDTQPIGVLVTSLPIATATIAAMPYARVGEHLYFPADGQFVPEVFPAELKSALPLAAYVLHPTAGLVGFGADDAISVADLLVSPVQRATSWDCAELGVHISERLHSVIAAEQPDLPIIFEAGRDDIGSEAFENLPRSPDESPLRDAAANAVRRMTRPLLRAMARLAATDKGQGKTSARKPSSTPGKQAGAGGRFARWSAARLNAMSVALQNYRNRELNRLLSLLGDDPDKGLQYALPLHALGTRGKAPPGNQLTRRSTDFSLSGLLGGNCAADPWNIPPDVEQQLRVKYRESANRELNLGRFRRAAYIFGYLLGDYSAAANALRRGGHYREAAVIYKERLKDLRASADCLVEGGMLTEAIGLYKALGQFEIAGDLHARLGQNQDAREWYLRAVEQIKQRKDFIAAAKLWETKLASPESALELLGRTWPDKDDSGLCLREWFALAGRLGRHDLAIRRVESLKEDILLVGSGLTLAQSLSVVGRGYPDSTVRSETADATRVIVGNRLTTANSTENHALVKALTDMMPGDLLLRRDGERFLDTRKTTPQPIPLKPSGPRLLQSFRLPDDFHLWHSVVRNTGGILALGSEENRFVMVRRRWDGRMSYDVQPHHAAANSSYILIPPGSADSALLAEVSEDGPALMPQFLLHALDVFESQLMVESPAYFSGTLIGACREENGSVWVLKAGRDTSLSSFGIRGTILASYKVELSHLVDLSQRPMAARKGDVFIADRNEILHFHNGNFGTCHRIQFPAQIQSLVPSPPFTTPRLLVGFAEGAAIVWASGEYQMIARSLIAPVATFTPEGMVVAVGGGSGQIYKLVNSSLKLDTDFKTGLGIPLAVVPAENGSFAAFYPDGNVQVFSR